MICWQYWETYMWRFRKPHENEDTINRVGIFSLAAGHHSPILQNTSLVGNVANCLYVTRAWHSLYTIPSFSPHHKSQFHSSLTTSGYPHRDNLFSEFPTRIELEDIQEVVMNTLWESFLYPLLFNRKHI